MTVRAYHRTSAASAEVILRDGFEDREGSYMTGSLHVGVWVTIERPWDIDLPPGDDPALLVIEIPHELFVAHEWVEDGKGYREALVPAAQLNQYQVWRAWECAECEAIAPEGSPGWHSDLVTFGVRSAPVERVSVCPDCS